MAGSSDIPVSGPPASDPAAPGDDMQALFLAWRRGESGAFDSLFSLLYDQLRTLAHRQAARAGAGETLRTTAVVHEAYLRLANNPQMDIEGREHFISLAARAMRFVLVDHARAKSSAKQGGNALPVTLDEARGFASHDPTADEVLLVDQTLEQLAALDARQARVFELRTFGGLTIDEIAGVLGIAPATVKRDWDKAKLFVARVLGDHATP